MSEIIPAILPTSLYDLELKLAQIPKEIKLVHIDVLEEDIWAGDIDRDFEAHLMVKRPEDIADTWIERGARRVVTHSVINPKAKSDVEIGLAVELQVPLEEIFSLIPQIDFINLMSIAEIGMQGHPFDEKIFDRIKEVKEKFPQVVMSVDGGINTTNYQKLLDLGVERLIVGSGFKELWKSLTQK